MITSQRAAPKSVIEMSETVAGCDRDRRKILVVGGDTLAGMGFPAQRVDLTLETRDMTGIVAYEPADLTVAARGGTAVQSLAAVLAGHGQFVPFDAPRASYATLGGTLAAGWAGPRRHAYGRPRDFVIGSTVVLADGTVASAGGMVVKNVAGYDLSRMYVGSFGTLGIVAQVNLKALVAPPRVRVFLARLPERTRTRAFAHLWSLKIRPAAAFWIDGFHTAVDGDAGDDGRLSILFEGSDALVERATRDLRAALGGAGVPETRIVDAGARKSFQRVVDAYVESLGERSITYRIYAFPHRCETIAASIAELARQLKLRSETIVDVFNGDVIARISDLDTHALGAKIERFDDLLHETQRGAQVIAGAHPHRAYLRVWGDEPAAIEHMRALKRRFDPNRTLNPGRFVGGI